MCKFAFGISSIMLALFGFRIIPIFVFPYHSAFATRFVLRRTLQAWWECTWRRCCLYSLQGPTEPGMTPPLLLYCSPGKFRT